MKAVILGSRGGYTAALLRDGTVEKIKNRGYRTGQEIDYQIGSPLKKTRFRRKRVIAAALLLILCAMGIWVYLTPYADVGLDATASLCYTVNWFQRVIAYGGVTDGGKRMEAELTDKGVLHSTVQDAVAQTVESLLQQADAVQEQEILITVAAKNDAFAGRLADKLQKTAAQTETEGTLRVMSMVVSRLYAQEVMAQGVSPGKLALTKALASVYPEDAAPFQRDAWLERPVQDITEALLTYRAQKEAAQKAKTPSQETADTPSEGTGAAGQEPANGQTAEVLPLTPAVDLLPQNEEPPLQQPEKPAVPIQ